MLLLFKYTSFPKIYKIYQTKIECQPQAQYIFNNPLAMLNLGLSVVIFLAIGIVVMALFCLVTRYFNKKLEKAMDDQNQVYSMIEQIRGKEEVDQDADNQYENYVNKRENDDMRKGDKNQPFELEMTEVKQPLKGYGDDIYGLGRLKRRLEGESIPMNPETGRSISSLKSFKPQKLDSMRKSNVSNRSNKSDDPLMDGNDPNQPIQDPTRPQARRDKKKDSVTIHKYISKIVSYVAEGIFIIENNLISISKRETVVQKRNTKNSVIKPDQNSFDDTLQAYGFEKETFCAFKFQTTLQIPHMKANEEYPVGSLKGSESKEQIEFAEFYNIKDKLQGDD